MTRRRTVLHLITTLDRGGAEKAVLHLTRAMAAGGRWEPRVMWLKGKGELAEEFAAAGVPAGRFSRREFERLGADVVNTHLFKADVAGAALLGRRSRRRRGVLVSTKHNEDRYLAGASIRAATWRTVARRAARRADAVVAISRAVAKFFRQTVGESFGVMPVIHYGVPAPRAVSPEEAAEFRAGLGIGKDDLVVLSVGRLDAQKDPATLIRAMPDVKAARPVRLVLLGRGPLETDLRELARNTAGANVVFAGFTERPGAAYECADVVALASRWEGLGLALVEAAQRGKPVVATRIGGIPEIVIAGGTGLLVPAADPPAMAAALTRLFGDDDLRGRMGERARASSARRFSVERYAAETEDLYERLLEKRRR